MLIGTWVPKNGIKMAWQSPLRLQAQWRLGIMKKWVNVVRQVVKDEEGAVLIEYTVSFAILTLAVIMGLVAVSRWIGALILG
jgi:Flp pilus assembly pilin Flp